MAKEANPTQMLVVRAPIGGLHTSIGPLDIDPTESPSMLNMRPFKSHIQLRQGLRKIGSTLNNPVVGLTTFHRADGVAIPVAWTTTKMYKWDAATSDWLLLTGTLTGTDKDLISSAVVFNNLIFTNGVDGIKTWDGTAAGFSALGGSPPNGKYVVGWADRLWIGNIVGAPQSVAWSGSGVVTDWISASSGTKLFMHDESFIQALRVISGRLMVVQEKSLSVGERTGDSLNPFNWTDGALMQIGLLGPRAFVDLGDKILFFGNGHAYEYNLSALNEIDELLTQDIFDLFSLSNIARAVSLPIFNGTEWWYLFPEVATYPDTVLVYNWTTKKWYKHALNALCAGFFQYSLTATWDALVGTWDAQTWFFGSSSTAFSQDLPVIGNVLGEVYEITDDVILDGVSPVIGTWLSKAFDFDMPGVLKTIKRVRVGYNAIEQTDPQIAVEISKDEGQTFLTAQTKTLESLGATSKRYAYFDFFETGETFNIRVTNAPNTEMQVYEVALFYVVRGPSVPPAP